MLDIMNRVFFPGGKYKLKDYVDAGQDRQKPGSL